MKISLNGSETTQEEEKSAQSKPENSLNLYAAVKEQIRSGVDPQFINAMLDLNSGLNETSPTSKTRCDSLT